MIYQHTTKKIPPLLDQIHRAEKDWDLRVQGKLTFRECKVEIPTENFTPKKLKNIREKELHVSQKILASSLGVSVRTLQGWEIGKSKPMAPIARLLTLLREIPDVRKKLLPLLS